MPTSAVHLAVTPESFVWSLEAISREQRLPFPRETLLQRFPPPHDFASVQLAVKEMGIDSELRVLTLAALRPMALPLYLLMREAPAPPPASTQAPSAGQAGAPVMHRLAKLVRCDARGVVLDGHEGQCALARAHFDALYTGDALVVAGAGRAAALEPDDSPQRPRFDLRWFGRELMRYPGIWRDVLIASLAVQLLALLVPLLTQVVIDKVLTHRTVNTLVVVAAALALVVVFSAVMGWIRQYLVLHTGNRVDAVLGASVFDHLLRLPARYFEHRPTGVLVARLQCVETIREFVAGAALTLLLDLPFMLVFTAIMYYYSPTLTWIAFAVLALLLAASVAITPVLRLRINQQFLAGARHQAFVTEYLAGIETVKSLQAEPQLGRRYEALFADYLAAGFAARQLANTFHALATALEQLLSVGVLCAGAWLVLSGTDLSVGALIAFQMFAARLAQPVLRIAGLWQEFQQVEVAVRRLGDIMNVATEPFALKAIARAGGGARIECRNVGFRYGRNRPWLFRGLSFVLEPGGCVALVGASGSGKSTLSRLLRGFYLATEGSVYLDGADIADMAANVLRSHLGVVLQETRLFSGTILANVLEGNATASAEDAMAACRLARIHDFVECLPEGYLTQLGENGGGLSGGQKQRLAIARALVRQPRLLVLDEPASSLDAELGSAFIDAINGLRGRVSVLFIAHEPPAGLRCDRVVRLDRADAGDAP